MVTHSVYFQRQNDSKISMLIKACRSLSVKNCHAKGRELTPRMHSQLRRVDRRLQKISAVCSMLQWQNRSTFWQFTGSATRRHCARLISKNILEEKFFVGTNFCELVFDHENCENFCLTTISHHTVVWHSFFNAEKTIFKKKLQGFGTSTSPTFQLTLSFLGWVWALDYTTPTNMGMRVSYLYVHKSQSC